VSSLILRRFGFYLLPPLLAICTLIFVNFKTDLSAFIIAGGSADEILLASEMQSGTLSRRYLVSVGVIKQGDEKVSTKFIQSFKVQLQGIEGVADVWIPGQQGDITQTIQSLYGQYANGIYSLNPADDLEHIFSFSGLNQRAEFLKNMLLSPQAASFKPLVLQDPLLLTLNGFQSQQSLLKKALIKDDRYQNLILQTEAAGLDSYKQSKIQQQIKALFQVVNSTYSKQYSLEMTGVPIFAVATQQFMQGDITKVSVLSSLLLTLIFLLIFRSFSAMFQVFSVLIIVILTAILTTQLIFGYVHGMTVAIGATLVGICIDYPIHALAHAQAVKQSSRLPIVAKVWPSMVIGGFTTMIGYIALGISGYPGFQQVAIFACTGILVSLLLTRFVLPRLVTSDQTSVLKVPLVTYWAFFTQKYRGWLIALIVILLALSVSGLKSLHWMQDMQELTPELDYLKQNDKRIRQRMTSIEPGRFVLITADNIELALQKAEQVYPLLDQLKRTGDLSEYFGLFPWVMSEKQQSINQAELRKQLTVEKQLLWQQALKTQGLSVNKLGRLDYLSNDMLRLDEVLATSISKMIDSRIFVTDQQAIILLWLGQHQPELVNKVLQPIQGVQYFSQRDMLNNMTKDYTQRAQKMLFAGVVLIVLLLLFRYKSITKTLQTLLPAVLAAFLILSFWSITGVAISFLHLVGFLLVVAICVDYGIFYQENRGGDISLTYQAMAVSMLTSAIAFGCLLTADSGALRVLSGVVALGVIIGFILCPIIIKQKHEQEQ